MRLLLDFARAYSGRTAAALVCLLIGGVAEGIGISSLLPLIHVLAPSAHTSGEGAKVESFAIGVIHGLGLDPTSGTLLSLIVIAITVKAVLVLLANRQVGYTVAHVATDLRLSLIRSLLRTRWQYYVHQPLGAFANAIASEARRASDAYLHGATILSLLVQSGVYAVVACMVSWRASVAALLAGTVVVYALNRLVHAARRAGARQTRLSRTLLTRLTDTLQAVKPLKAMAREMLVGPLLEVDTRRLNRALEREVLSREALRALQEPLQVAFVASGLYFALTYTDLPLAALLMLALLCSQVVSNLGRVQKELQRMVTCESAYWSLRATIDEAEAAREVLSGTTSPTLREGIVLDGVSFAYDERAVLRAASLAIPARQMTVLIGPSGAGKTTLADLVIGLAEPQSGEVLVDGVPLASLDAQRWRSMIGYVPQETFLLHDTVRMNITLGDPDLTEADVDAALRAAGAWQFVADLPEGMDTAVGERGLRLSGGQRQRIALARALVRRPALLVLDEATTGLDPATEAGICSTLAALRDRMTLLAITHQGPLVGLADQVLEVDGGSVRKSPAIRLVSGDLS